MSKRIPYVHDIQLENPTGAKVFHAKEGGDPNSPVVDESRPVLATHLAYLRDRVSDQSFGEGISAAIDADDLRYETRKCLREQEADAKKRGYWELDNDKAEKLLNAVLKWAPQTAEARAMGFNFVPFARAVRAQTPTPVEAIDLPPVTNGVSAQAS
jgi:hypothetical protein